MREIRTIVIAGAGTMGAPIAETFAKFGYAAILYDVFEEALEKARTLIALNQRTEVSEDVVSEEASASALGRIVYSSDKACFNDADFVIEAIPERLDFKLAFWSEVSELVPKDAVLASNTSGLSISKIAEAVKDPGRFAGMHWINPAHIIPLIEIVKGVRTKEESAAAIGNLALRVGKKPVVVKDAPGFVMNRIQLAILRECLYIEEHDMASAEAIDDVVKYGLGPRYACMGPFRVADLGGLDEYRNISDYLFPDLSNATSAFGLLKRCVDHNRLGVKSGAGVYDYASGGDAEIIRYRDKMCTKILKSLSDDEDVYENRA